MGLLPPFSYCCTAGKQLPLRALVVRDLATWGSFSLLVLAMWPGTLINGTGLVITHLVHFFIPPLYVPEKCFFPFLISN